jgi:hypothetical protein
MRDLLAYYLTWTTYGSWLPGDERGWVAKPGRRLAPDVRREQAALELMTESVLTLDVEQRLTAEDTIAEHCLIRGWHLHAVNARTQHIHVVVTAPGRHPDVVMDQFKAWCTRHLKRLARSRGPAVRPFREKMWTQGGSKQRVYDERGLEAVIRYVMEEQGDPTPRPPDRPLPGTGPTRPRA